ncbi:energy transducer TonB [Pedobacter sp. G11]|uniref:energy transducer TonB n=1 Tax=Pedobacter sp. G11 TaxID=2482728 RepID=UPI000F5FF470|nr:energy transducer TonB [Pedobacter sp. G11]AZI26956.1 energy transducer TonB [Pedobacter sp. G11]
MMMKLSLTLAIFLGITTLSFAQGKRPDFTFKLENTTYFVNLSKGSTKAEYDTVFYNFYRYGKPELLAKEIKHIVNRNTGDTIKSGSYRVVNNRVFFDRNEKNEATILKVYSFQDALKPAPIEPTPPYHNYGQPKQEQVETVAEFPGGINKARQFIANNLKYPKKAVEHGVNGTVQAKFTIEVDGSLTNIDIVKKLGYGCDEEVIRVLKSMPKWKPAILKGKSVKSYFTMPISFKTTE